MAIAAAPAVAPFGGLPAGDLAATIATGGDATDGEPRLHEFSAVVSQITSRPWNRVPGISRHASPIARPKCPQATIGAGTGGARNSRRESGFSLAALGGSVAPQARRPTVGRWLSPQPFEPVPGNARVVRRVLWIAVPEVILRSHAKLLLADRGSMTSLVAAVGSCNWLSTPYQSFTSAPRCDLIGRLSALARQLEQEFQFQGFGERQSRAWR